MSDWNKHKVSCTECGASIERRLFRPKDGKRIDRFFCDTQCKGTWQRDQNLYGSEWLRQKYEVDRLDCVQIGKLVHRDPKSIWSWLKGFGIATRPRGGNHGKPKAPQKQKGEFPYWKGKTGPAHPSWRGGATPERQAFYSSEEWRSARKAAFTSAKWQCERCGCADRLQVHHVIPFVNKRTRSAIWNLRVLCMPCHKFVHSQANGDREFLPPFGSLIITKGGVTHIIPIGHRPTHQARLPSWLAP